MIKHSKIRLFATTCLSAGVTMAAALFASPAQAENALPSGGSVVAGNATIGAASSGNQTITQTSNRAVINWRSFDVGPNNAITFVQPNANAATLNRVTGDTTSTIAGQIRANGAVYLINPNGIQITSSGTVHAGRGFVASTLDIANADFMAGNGSFSGDGNGWVDHRGSIITDTGGTVGLLGGNVNVSGRIVAPAGKVVIGAVKTATLDLNGDGFLQVALPAKAAISADGNAALVSMQDAYLAARNVVNLDGASASAVSGQNGHVSLTGNVNVDSNGAGNGGSIVVMGNTTQASGLLSARAIGAAGDGGFVETSGNHVDLNGLRVDTSAAHGKTGTWLIDPVDFTIAASGGDITGSQLSANLASNNVVISSTQGTSGTDGDIHVNEAVSWSSGNSLTLNAWRHININQNITASGANAALILRADDTGTGTGTINFSNGATASLTGTGSTATLYYNPAVFGVATAFGQVTAQGSVTAYQLVNTLQKLQDINTNRNGNYALARNIDASATSGWNNGAGFVPLGGAGTPFAGQFDGQGYVISGLTINRPDSDYTGLFGRTQAGTKISNAGLIDSSITGRDNVGGLVGYSGNSTISQSYAAGVVNGRDSVGGLVGYNGGSLISQSYAAGVVSGTSRVGGLIGYNGGSGGTISQSYATAAVNGTSSYIGGLIGRLNSGAVSESYATGAVNSSDTYSGGLVGFNEYGTVTNSYWDRYSTGKIAGIGISQFGTVTNLLAVTSDPGQSGAADYAYSEAAYANFTAADWIFLNGQTRPFGAWEAPKAVGGVAAIANAHQLQLIHASSALLSGNYVLSRDIDLSETGAVIVGTPGSYAGMWADTGFMSLGNDTTPFNGTFDGQRYVISNLMINHPNEFLAGLFGYINHGATVKNVGLIGGSVHSGEYTGGLAGVNVGTISNAYAAIDVTSTNTAGGLVGFNYGGTINNAYATGNATGGAFVGGLVGYSYDGRISNAYATGEASTYGYAAGGLVGFLTEGTINNAYATGIVSGTSNVEMGGLIGRNQQGVVSNAYWDSYSTTLSNAAGADFGTLTNVNAVTSDPTQSNAANYAYKASAWANFVGNGGDSDIDLTGGQALNWRMYDGNTIPLLKAFLTTTNISASSATLTYDGNAQTITGYSAPTDTDLTKILGTTVDTGGTGTDAGTYAHAISGLYSNQQGLDIVITTGSLVIAPRPLSVVYTAAPASSIYGDTPTGLTGSVSSSGLVNGDVLGGTASWATTASGTSNVGSYAITGSSITASSNYTISASQAAANATALTITPRALSVVYTATPSSSIYGDTPAGLTGSVSSSGLVNGDVLGGTASWATTASGTSNVGSYAITGSGIANSNYTISASQAAANATALTITPRMITVTANAQQRITGLANPVLTYGITSSNLVNGDTLTGGLATVADLFSTPGDYAITQGTLAATPNYALTYVGAVLKVTPAPTHATSSVVCSNDVGYNFTATGGDDVNQTVLSINNDGSTDEGIVGRDASPADGKSAVQCRSQG